jgi:hypothetical protein
LSPHLTEDTSELFDLQPWGRLIGKVRLGLCICAGPYLFSFASICESAGADLSALFGAVTHDITVPYADDKYVPEEKNRSAYEKARQILRDENILKTARPLLGPVPKLSEAYGKALSLGTGTTRVLVLPEIAELHGIAVGGDRKAIRQQIHIIYEKIGRKDPTDNAMEKLVDAVRDASGTGGDANEEFSIKKPEYEVHSKYSPTLGKVATEVTGKANDSPFRAVFEGEIKAAPASNGKDMELSAKPAEKPRIIDAKESERLAPLIAGDWMDNENNLWKVELNGSSITLTTMGMRQHPVVYKGKYELGAISAQHNVDDPDDIKDDLPAAVKGELASRYHPPYIVHLEVPQEADKLTGTWTSSHVTYSGMTQSVSSIHDPWDKPLVLTRKLTSGIALGMKDGDFP